VEYQHRRETEPTQMALDKISVHLISALG